MGPQEPGHTGAGWGRSGVINNSVAQVGQRRAIVQRFANALVCGVAGGIDTATQQNPVACVQFWQIGTNFICGDFVGHTLIHPFFPAGLQGFHSCADFIKYGRHLRHLLLGFLQRGGSLQGRGFIHFQQRLILCLGAVEQGVQLLAAEHRMLVGFLADRCSVAVGLRADLFCIGLCSRKDGVGLRAGFAEDLFCAGSGFGHQGVCSVFGFTSTSAIFFCSVWNLSTSGCRGGDGCLQGIDFFGVLAVGTLCIFQRLSSTGAGSLRGIPFSLRGAE